MANYFDQFDAPSTDATAATETPAAASNFFDQFDTPNAASIARPNADSSSGVVANTISRMSDALAPVKKWWLGSDAVGTADKDLAANGLPSFQLPPNATDADKQKLRRMNSFVAEGNKSDYEPGVWPSITSTLDKNTKLPSGKTIVGGIQGTTLTQAGGDLLGWISSPLEAANIHADFWNHQADLMEDKDSFFGRYMPDYAKQKADVLRQKATDIRASANQTARTGEDQDSWRTKSRDIARTMIDAGLDTLKNTQPTDPGLLESAILGGAKAVPQIAGAAVGGLVAGPPGIIASIGATQYGGSFADVVDNPNLTREQKQNYAASSAGLAMVLNAAPATIAMRPNQMAVQRFLKTLGVNLGAQEANGVAQQVLAQNSDVSKPLSPEEWGQLVLDAGIQALGFSGGEALVGHAKSLTPAGRRAALDAEMSPESQASKREEMFGQQVAPEEAPVTTPNLQIESKEVASPAAGLPAPKPTGVFAAGEEGGAREVSQNELNDIEARRAEQESLGTNNIVRVPKEDTSDEEAKQEVSLTREDKFSAARQQIIESIGKDASPEEISVAKSEDGQGWTIYHKDEPQVTYTNEEIARTEARGIRQELQEQPQNKATVLGQEIARPQAPTSAQAEAGNYRKPTINWKGMDIRVETTKGMTRSGIDESGKPFARVMQTDYGYFPGTKSTDGEGVDVFMGPHRGVRTAYVIDQLKSSGLEHDEPKVVIGARNEDEAKSLYLKNYPKGWKGLGAMTPMSVEGLKTWLHSGNTEQPLSWSAPVARPIQPVSNAPVRSTRVPQVQHDSILEYLSKTKLHGADSAGLSTAALESEGLDPKEMASAVGHGINKPFTKGGGSLDHAAEILTEAGYPVGGDKNKLLDLITSEIRQGKKTYAGAKSHDAELERLAEKYMTTPPTAEEVTAMSDKQLDELQNAIDARRERLSKEEEPIARVAEPTNAIDRLQQKFGVSEPKENYSAKPFYSHVVKTIDNSKLEKGTPSQWYFTLKNTPGVKQDELDWMGLKDWLDNQKGTVTRQQVSEFARANQIEVSHSLYGDPIINTKSKYALPEVLAAGKQASGNAHDELVMTVANDGDAYRALMKKFPELSKEDDWAEQVVDDVFDTRNKQTKFGKYTLPGGENYKEMLLTLPSSQFDSPEIRELQRMLRAADGGLAQTKPNSPEWKNFESRAKELRSKLVELTGDPYGMKRKASGADGRPGDYRSSHWDEPNVLAHIRFDERTDAQGKRALHIAEIQSDWHQAGRKRGYEAKDFAEKKKVFDEYSQVLADKYDLNPEQNLSMYATIKNMEPQEVSKYEQLQHDWLAAGKDRVPNAPFKTTWPELAFKRVIRHAAENGFDKITWDTGDTNADRYDLSKQLDSVLVRKSGDSGPYSIIGRVANRDVFVRHGLAPNELDDFIGKDLADKARAQETASYVYTGIDLKIGGEGMRSFYDKILPATVNKLTKKWGGKVSAGTLENTKGTGRMTSPNREGKSFPIDDEPPIPVHSLDITPQMHAAAMGGLPLFEAKLAYRSQMMIPFGREDAEKLSRIETRPDTNPVQARTGIAALKSLLAVRDVRSGARILASGLPRDFIDQGHAKLVGRTIESPEDLAQLAQVYRDPRFETLRFFLTQGDTIVDQIGVSSRLPGSVAFGLEGKNALESFDVLHGMMKNVNANGYYMLHNHPSGSPNPSIDDHQFTQIIADKVPGFKGHVVIDNNSYAVIQIAHGVTSEEIKHHDFGGYVTGKNPEIDHLALEASINSPLALAKVAKSFERPSNNHVVLIGISGRGQVRVVSHLPKALLEERGLKPLARIRRLALGSGSRSMFAVTDDYRPLTRFLQSGVLQDAIQWRGSGTYLDNPGFLPSNRYAVADGLGRAAFKSYRVEETKEGYQFNPPKAPGVVIPAGKAIVKGARNLVAAIPQTELLRSFRKIINPVGMSPESRSTAMIARAEFGELAWGTQVAQAKLEKFSRLIDTMSPADKLDMMDRIEGGREQASAPMQEAADAMRKMLDEEREKVQALGEGYLDNWIENYFPHIWQDHDAATKFVSQVMGRRPLKGPASFLKQRKIPTIREGMEEPFNLKPVTLNPLIATLLKLREMQRFRSGVMLMRKLKEAGLAKFVPAGAKRPTGWVEIKDAVGRVRQWSDVEQGFVERGLYMMPEDAARIINNHLSGSALRNFAPAQWIRVGSNLMNGLQLGFSGFHIGFTTLDAVISKNALGIERLIRGDVIGAGKAFLEASTGPIGAAINVHRGMELMKSYLNPAGATPMMQKIVLGLIAGGGRVKMDRYFLAAQNVSPFHGVGFTSLAQDVKRALSLPKGQVGKELARVTGNFPLEYSTKMWRDLQEMAVNTPKWQLPFELAGRITRASTSIIMEHIVPMQKLGVFADLAHDAIRREPEMSEARMQEVMQKIWNSVDNRLGEMVYDNLFWNRTFKDAMHLAVRAVGWNYGTISEIGGAPIDALKFLDNAARTGKLNADDLGHKIPYVISMVGTTMVLGAILCYLFTGKGPQKNRDYFFPPTGGTTNYGTEQRVSLPSYAKDVYEYSQHPLTTIANKLNPIYGSISDIINNEDFFGAGIYNPDAPPLEKAKEIGNFVAKETMPFSLQGNRQLAGSEKPGIGGTVRKVLPFIGVAPAPGYVTSPEEVERRHHVEEVQKYLKGVNYQLKQARDAHDHVKVQELSKERAQLLHTERKERLLMKHSTMKGKRQQREEKAADLSSTVGQIINGKPRGEAIRDLHDTGMPAMASLLHSLPAVARQDMMAFYQREATT